MIHFVIKKMIYLIFLFLSKSCRIITVTQDLRQKAKSMSPNHAFIVAAFHEHTFPCTISQKDDIFCALISQSKDGDYAASIIESLGHEAVRGSSTRGGAEAREAILEKATSGKNIAITIDGPKGPRRVCKPGVVSFSKKSGLSILPIVARGSREWIFYKSWDHFKLVLPFSKIYVGYGDPIMVDENAEGELFERYQREIEKSLIQLDKEISEKYL